MTCVNITCQQQQLGSRTGEEHLRQTLEPTYNSICQASMVEQSHVREALQFLFQTLWLELSGWWDSSCLSLFFTCHQQLVQPKTCQGIKPCYINLSMAITELQWLDAYCRATAVTILGLDTSSQGPLCIMIKQSLCMTW